jgi:pimeloyl-ACP methyl ester carboxylesterase
MGRDEANTLIGAEFLQLVPGLFSTDYATGSAALQQFIGMATYKELDVHTFYYLVGFNSVTLPASRQGMFMRELDNGAVLQAVNVPSLLINGKDDRIVLPAYSDYIASRIPHVSRVDYAFTVNRRPPADTSGELLPARTAGSSFLRNCSMITPAPARSSGR